MKISAKFVLNPSSKGLERPIVLLSRSRKFNSARFMYSTSEYCKVKDWSAKGFVKSSAPNSDQINSRLTQYKRAFEDAIQKLKEDTKIIDKEFIKSELQKLDLKPEMVEKVVDPSTIRRLVDFAEFEMNDNPQYVNYLGEKKELTEGTKRSKKQAIARLKDFEKACKYHVTLENADANFWKSFILFLKKRGLVPGTRGKIVKDLKSYLNSAIKKGYSVNQDFKIREVAPTEKSERRLVYLKEHEIEAIANLDLKERPQLENSRDWLLILCGLGLRHSDAIKLDHKEHLIDAEYGKGIRIKTQKTDTLVEIPFVFDWLSEMMERRKWTFPKPITAQKLNLNFKTIGKLAELNRRVEARIYDKEKKLWIVKDVPIAEALGSHVGRRSFASNMVRKELPLTLIAKMTGHKKLETLKIYEQLNESESASVVAAMVGKKMVANR